MNDVGIQQEVERRHFPITVEMYHQMGEKGSFAPDDRVELIEGELFQMSPIGSLHARCVKFLNNFFVTRLNELFVVGVQDPVTLDDRSEPQPDLSILRYKADFYKDATPRSEETVMVIEVADSSVSFDKNVKFRRYAATGIPEAWLIDLDAERVEVHTQPKENGYGVVRIYIRGENAVSENIPSVNLPVDDILG